MKLTLSLEQFKTALSLAERMTTKGSGLPVLAGVFLEAKEKTLVIRSTNLSIGIEEVISAKVEVEGRVVVPAQAMMAALSGSSSQTLSLSEEGGTLVMTLSHGRVSLRTMPAEDFPTLPRIDTVNPWKLKTKDIIAGLKAVSFAAAQTEIKPELASIYLHQEGEQIITVATDAFRLAEKRISGATTGDSFPSILIPARLAQEIIKALPEGDDEVLIAVSENQLSLELPNRYLTTRLVSGTYPPYQAILPKTSTTSLIALRSDLQALLRTLAPFTDKDFRIEVSIDPAAGTCRWRASHGDLGEAQYDLPTTLTGNPLEIRIHHKHLAEVLSFISTDSLSIEATESNKPLLVKPVGDSSFQYLMMPLSR